MYIPQTDTFTTKDTPWVRLLLKIKHDYEKGLLVTESVQSSLLSELNLTATKFDTALEYLHNHKLILRNQTNAFEITELGSEVAQNFESQHHAKKQAEYNPLIIVLILGFLGLMGLFLYIEYAALSIITGVLLVVLLFYFKYKK